MDNVKTIAETIQYIVISLGLIIGGGWTFYHFFLQREFSTSLLIEALTNTSFVTNRNSVVFINIILKNTGKTNIKAMPKKYIEGKLSPIWKNEWGTTYHSCGLQIKELCTTDDGNTFYDWYETSKFSKVENIPEEINLLDDYEVSTTGEVDFWLEPGDTVNLSTAMILHSGHYLAKVNFWGTKINKEYWCHTFYIQVPIQVS